MRFDVLFVFCTKSPNLKARVSVFVKKGKQKRLNRNEKD